MNRESLSFDQQGLTFWGADYYPYGLDRSGEFTRQQVELLKAHGYAYEGLARGDREASNAEEAAFVEVFRNGRPPQTHHEKLWQRFVEGSSRRNEIISTSSAWLSASVGASLEMNDLSDFV